ncbi:MAG: ABC transporter ATP-binding protein [Betaproteobacteria bacterium]|nr:ABC transporter ATP-binding protein [Betaproteobacteria bacterium]
MPIIEVNHVTKEYQLGALKNIKQTVRNAFARLRGQQVEQHAPFKALDDVSFSIEAGEVVGIIGHNGAGKSTMLKLLANISKPSSGSIQVKGKIAPLIEVGAGLVGDLTGRENIYLNGAILGIPKAEISRKFDEIVTFAELEEFIDTPIKRYSSGMQVRLGFSIATSVESDILIVDEVLAVGDLAFQRKCFDRMESLIKSKGNTVLLVSHNIRQVEHICQRTILLDHGTVVADGSSKEVCGQFFELSDEKIRREVSSRPHDQGRNEESDVAELLDVFVTDTSGQRIETMPYMSEVMFNARFRTRKPLCNATFGFGVHTTDLLYLATEINEDIFHGKILEPGEYCVRLTINQFPFLPGVYSLRIGMTAEEGCRSIFYAENVAHLQITAPESIRTQAMREGFVAMRGSWSVVADDNMTASTHPNLAKPHNNIAA